tara:strand:+ start:139 stop:399 length:261 start_codon:yes stop_codon:yes gene_type:complete
MKISKRQLKRIIREEKSRLLETRDQVDQNLKSYQDSVYGDDYADAEPKLQDALYTMLEAFIEMNGVSEAEAAQMVIDYAKETLGVM